MVRSRRIAIFVENLYQELELWYPLLRLQEEDIATTLVGTGERDVYTGKNGYPARSEVTASMIGPRDFDGAVIPGGFAPDYLRRSPAVVNLVRELYQQGKVIGAVCHGPCVLISAEVLRGKRVTGVSSIRDDIINAGGEFVNEPMVRDGNIITARGPEDLPVFMREILGFLWKQKPRLDEAIPDGKFLDVNAQVGSLSEVITGKPALLVFIDSIFSPRASSVLPRLDDLAKELELRGGIMAGITGDSFFAVLEFLGEVELSYPLFCDSYKDLAKVFGVMGDVGLSDWSVFLSDRSGMLRYSESWAGGDIESLPGFRKQLENIVS